MLPANQRELLKKKILPVGNVLLAALRKLGMTELARQLEIEVAWRHVVGKKTVARAVPHSFARGVLTVKSSSPAWQNELTFLKADLVTQLNAHLGRRVVTELRVVGGAVEAAAPEAAPPPEPSAQDAARATEIATSIADPALREAFSGMVTQALCQARNKARTSGVKSRPGP